MRGGVRHESGEVQPVLPRFMQMRQPLCPVLGRGPPCAHVRLVRIFFIDVSLHAPCRTGAKAMGAMRGAMDVDKVDDLVDYIREEMDTATHISEAISTPLDGGLQDDDDLLAELDAMVEEETEAKLTQVPASLPVKPGMAETAPEPFPELPAVPTNKPVASPGLEALEGVDEEELRALK